MVNIICFQVDLIRSRKNVSVLDSPPTFFSDCVMQFKHNIIVSPLHYYVQSYMTCLNNIELFFMIILTGIYIHINLIMSNLHDVFCYQQIKEYLTNISIIYENSITLLRKISHYKVIFIPAKQPPSVAFPSPSRSSAKDAQCFEACAKIIFSPVQVNDPQTLLLKKNRWKDFLAYVSDAFRTKKKYLKEIFFCSLQTFFSS